ncbi:UNVERIFIED_CONTAM: hypothetical protein FKN15_070305 [Acipenser sinensis]
MEANSSQSAVESGGDHASTAGAGALERSEINSPFPQPKQRSLRVVYVLNDGLKAVQANSPESGALQCLQRACDAESAILATVTFGTLDFGETSVLDTFYDAGNAIDDNVAFIQAELQFSCGVVILAALHSSRWLFV